MNKLVSISLKIEQVAGAERITKQILAELSREVLDYVVLDSQDSQVVNRLLSALTPINKKAATLFFQAFLAFNFNADDGAFGKKDKKDWDKKLEKVNEFLADPLNTLWTWADRNIELAPVPMDFAKLNAAMGSLIKKADKAKLGHNNVVRALLANGITTDDILEVLKAMADEQPKEQAANDEQKQQGQAA